MQRRWKMISKTLYTLQILTWFALAVLLIAIQGGK